MLTDRTSRLMAALGLLLLSPPVFAGEVYSFVTEQQGGMEDGPTKGRLLVDGTRFRMEHEPKDDEPRRAVISKDCGEHRFQLNLENRTFFEIDQYPGAATSHLFWLIPVNGDRSMSNVKVELIDRPETETVAGTTARRREIKVSYDITIKIKPPEPPAGRPPFKGPTETVRGKVKLEAIYWLAEDRAPLPCGLFKPEIRTSFPEIDGKLADAVAALRGFAVKQQVTVTAEGEPYVPLRTMATTTTVEGPRPAKTSPSLFEVPGGFRIHKPEFTRPGLEAAPSPPG